jgi:hypothetical protein
MKRYTLKTIKKTKCYQANIEAVRAIYPGHEDDFARELMIAANEASADWSDHSGITFAFLFHKTPQDSKPWVDLVKAIRKYNTEQTKND